MQAIQVKYLSPTKAKPYSKLKATCDGGSIVEYKNHYISEEKQALELAFKLANKLGWNVEKFAIGSFKNCYYVNASKTN